jgi:hypothetical protein
MTPPTNIKKYRKWKKEQYQLIEYDLKQKGDIIERLSPFYSAATGDTKTSEALSIFNEDSNSYQMLKAGYSGGVDINKSMVKSHQQICSSLRSLIVYDKGIAEYEVNDDSAKQARDSGILEISSLIYELSAESKYFFLKNLCELGELSSMSEARLCWDCYYENNDMKSDFTYKIGEMLIKRVDNDALDEILEWEMKQFQRDEDITLRNEMCIKDALLLQEYRNKGELFYAYRGFLVEQDEYVREGKKADGEAYYKWKAGKGLSFSFNKDTAYYFCYWQMCFMELEGKFKGKDNPLRQIPNSIKTKEEYIEEVADKISQMIDACGKKPIVGRFMIEPTSIAMATSAKNEAEINVEPEEVVLVDYKIASSRQIAEAVYNKSYSTWVETSDVFNDINESKVVMLNTGDGKGGWQVIFANVKDIKDDIDKAKAEYKDNGDAKAFHIKLERIFKDNAVEIPKNINTRRNPTKRLWDFLTRNEEYLVRKRAQAYVSGTS